jgi:hypothetical protein
VESLLSRQFLVRGQLSALLQGDQFVIGRHGKIHDGVKPPFSFVIITKAWRVLLANSVVNPTTPIGNVCSHYRLLGRLLIPVISEVEVEARQARR